MKKVLLVVAMLLLATPIFAASDVTITATQLLPAPDSPLQQVTIAYTGAAEANSIRAFALSLTTDLDSNAVISNIRGFKRGESKTGNLGYGIFPARFRQYITPLNGTDVNSTGGYGWQDGNYTPLAIWGDVNAGWGENTKWIVTELGTLYQGEANAPGTSGTLFVIDVNNPDKADCNLCIALDQIRGGVVKKDTTSATVTLPPGGSGAPAGCIRIDYPSAVCTVPNVISQTEAAGTAAITGAGFTLGTRTTACSDVAGIVAGDIISTNPAAGTAPCGSAVAYVVSTGPCCTAPAAPASITVPATDADGKYNVTWAASAGATSYQLEDACDTVNWKQVYSGTALTYAVKVGGGTWRYRVKATNACGSSGFTAGGNTCVVTDCLKSTTPAAELTAWKKWRYPASWCFNRQCRGDINGAISLGKPITSADMTIFSAAFNKTDAELEAVAGGIGADLNHTASLGKRVTSADMTIFSTYFNLATASVPCCDTVAPAGDCTLAGTDKYSYWTTP